MACYRKAGVVACLLVMRSLFFFRKNLHDVIKSSPIEMCEVQKIILGVCR